MSIQQSNEIIKNNLTCEFVISMTLVGYRFFPRKIIDNMENKSVKIILKRIRKYVLQI